MLFHIDFKTGKPAYLQLVDQVRYAAASGALRPGDSLPSIRPLAEEMCVNKNTIAKAYAELESQGVIETIPGKGFYPMFRFYTPKEGVFDGTWKLPDVEAVK